MLLRIDIPIIVNTFFLHDVQISMCRPSDINIFSGTRTVSSFGTQRWTRGSMWWRQIKSFCIGQKSARASTSSVGSDGRDSSASPWSSPLRSSLLTVDCCLRVGSRSYEPLPVNFAVPSAIGNMNSSSSCLISIFFAKVLQGKISDASKSLDSSRSAIRISLFQIHTAISS